MKRIYRAGWTFFATLQRNRLGRLTKKNGYQGLDMLEPPPQGWNQDVEMRPKEVSFGVKPFKLVATNIGIK